MSDNRETNCEMFAEAVSLLGTGDLPATDRAAVHEHVSRCDACRYQLDQIQALTASLTGVAPVWLESASQTVTQQLANQIGVQLKVTKCDHELEAASHGNRTRGRMARLQRGRGWWAVGAISAAVVWGVLSGWLGGGWKTWSPHPVAPESFADAMPSIEHPGPESGHDERSEFPTWWELQRSLAASNEVFERTLARGHSARFPRSIELNHLLEELTQ